MKKKTLREEIAELKKEVKRLTTKISPISNRFDQEEMQGIARKNCSACNGDNYAHSCGRSSQY